MTRPYEIEFCDTMMRQVPSEDRPSASGASGDDRKTRTTTSEADRTYLRAIYRSAPAFALTAFATWSLGYWLRFSANPFEALMGVF